MSKRSRTIKNLLITLAFTGLVTYVCILVINGKDKPQPKPTPPAAQACTIKACMEITQVDGKKYQLNDFRFLPQHCIAFISMPDAARRQTCGDYKLEWIGPDLKQLKEQQI